MYGELSLNGPAATILAMLTAVAIPVQAQPRWECSGYISELPSYQRHRPGIAQLASMDEDQFLNLARLRIRPTVLLWDEARIVLEHETTVWLRNSSTAFPQTSETPRRQIGALRWTAVSEPHAAVAHAVDRLYFRQNFSSGSLVIGRQRIAWGAGRIWNPTDLFNPINPASFEKIEKDGADAVAAKYYFGSLSDVEVVYNPEDNFKQSNVGVRFRTNAAGYDLSLLGGAFDRSAVIGGDFAGNFFTAGLRGEGIVRFEENTSVARYIVGLDHQFTPRLYALIEYQFNGEGKCDPGSYELGRLFTADLINLARQYIAVSATYQLHPLLTAAATANVNLNDGSGFVSPKVTYSVSSGVDLSAGGLLSYGQERSEYRNYPTSVYVHGTVYF